MIIPELSQKFIRVIRSQWRHFEYNISRKINMNWFDVARYQLLMVERPNLKNPKTWSEKLLWLNRHWQPSIKSECTDKLKVRNYLKNEGLEFLLVPILGVWSLPEEIDFDSLPNQFVLKCNHGCGCNIICKDKSKLDILLAKKKLEKWLKTDYGKLFNEKYYSKIKPMIFCEEYLPSLDDNVSVIDYKIHCFHGEPEFFEVLSNRDNGTKKVTSTAYSLNWDKLDYGREILDNQDLVSRPVSLEKMVEYARQLSKPFPYIRIDFYEIRGVPLFSEMTFTPGANIDCDFNMATHKKWVKNYFFKCITNLSFIFCYRYGLNYAVNSFKLKK